MRRTRSTSEFATASFGASSGGPGPSESRLPSSNRRGVAFAADGRFAVVRLSPDGVATDIDTSRRCGKRFGDDAQVSGLPERAFDLVGAEGWLDGVLAHDPTALLLRAADGSVVQRSATMNHTLAPPSCDDNIFAWSPEDRAFIGTCRESIPMLRLLTPGATAVVVPAFREEAPEAIMVGRFIDLNPTGPGHWLVDVGNGAAHEVRGSLVAPPGSVSLYQSEGFIVRIDTQRPLQRGRIARATTRQLTAFRAGQWLAIEPMEGPVRIVATSDGHSVGTFPHMPIAVVGERGLVPVAPRPFGYEQVRQLVLGPLRWVPIESALSRPAN